MSALRQEMPPTARNPTSHRWVCRSWPEADSSGKFDSHPGFLRFGSVGTDAVQRLPIRRRHFRFKRL